MRFLNFGLVLSGSLVCSLAWSQNDTYDVKSLEMEPDGTVSAVFAPSVVLVPDVAKPLSAGAPQIAGSEDSVPAPASAALELTRLSDAELTDFCVVRQERMLYLLRRVESIRISLALLDADIAKARKQGSAVLDPSVSAEVAADVWSEVELTRQSLLAEAASRKAEYRDLYPSVQQAVFEQRRRGLAVRDLPALMNNEAQ